MYTLKISSHETVYYLSLIFLFIPFNSVSPIFVTPKEERALQELKERILTELPPNFGSSDANIIRYLRAKNLNVDQTVEYIRSEIQWWKEQRMDTIHKEDWSNIEWQLPMRVEGYDRKGQPIVYLDASEWDLRHLIITGNTDKFRRWLYKNWDEARIETVKQADAGKNVTKWLFLVDAKATPWTNFSPMSISTFPTILLTLVNHFQLPFDEAIIINAPAIVETAMAVARSVVPNAAKLFRVYGTNRNQWSPELRKLVDPAVLRKRYGGDKDEY